MPVRLRNAFTMKLKSGALPEYARRHQAPWPELMDQIGRQGVRKFSIFVSGDSDLFVYSELDAPDAWQRVWATPVHERWGAEMQPLLAVDERGAPQAATLKEIFHFRRPRK